MSVTSLIVGEDTAVVTLLRVIVTATSQLGVLLVALVLLMAKGTYPYQWREPEKIMIEFFKPFGLSHLRP